ncbi:MAG TPA: histidinol-phosphatase HisJ family protein [Coriobacteriia bacterium]|nr:histidinol-phosphatase HisJ family protein [Coriobacteriia bacterium]
MRELIDCHLHTEACGHASGTVAQMVSAAVFAGLTGIVMTEHLPLPADLDPGEYLSPKSGQFASYAQEVRGMAARVKGVDVVLGAEADWLPWRMEDTEAQLLLAREAGVDIILGSVHSLDGWVFDDPTDTSEWDHRNVDEVWVQYFERWCDAARSGHFDVMAHPDLPKKFGHKPSFDTRELYAGAAQAAADAGVLIEVSTAGLRKPVGELYPGPELLAAFRQAGVEITVGSDAHEPGDVGRDILAAYDAAASAGYERVAFPLRRGEVRWIEL